MLESHNKNVSIYLILFVFPFVVYCPVILTSYAFLDDYTLTAFGMQHIQWRTIAQVVELGRPISAVFIQLAFGLVHEISDLRFIRAGSIAGIGVLNIVSYRSLVRAEVGAATAICVALMLGLMPAYQVFASWAVAAPYPWAALLAAIAFNVQDAAGWRRGMASFLLLTAATAIYQPAAMVFWVFAAIAWLVPGQLPSIQRMLCAGLIMVSAMAADFALMKVLPIIMFHAANGFARTDLTHDIVGKLVWFVTNPLFNALNLFSIEPSVLFAAVVGFICIAGLIVGFRRKAVIALVIALALLPAAYVPNLVTVENWSSYRTQVALGGVVLVIALSAVLAFARSLRGTQFVPILGAAALVWASFFAHHDVHHDFALSNAAEYQAISESILATNLQPGERVCFKIPVTGSAIATDHRYDEFGIFSSSAVWVPDPMVWLILQAQHSKDAGMFANFSQFPNTMALPGCEIIDLSFALGKISTS